MKTCLILGAGGFLGRNLCKELLSDCKIVAYDRFFPDELLRLSGDIKFVKGDFAETKDFSDVLDGVDSVFHLISTTVPKDDTSDMDVEIMQNIIPTVRLLESMVKCKTKEILFFSSGGTVYGEGDEMPHKTCDDLRPICGYGMQKKTIESYIEFYGSRYGIDYKILRISNPYGVGQDPSKPQGIIPIYIYHLLNNMPITVYGDGNTERDYIAISDLMNQIHLILNYRGNIKIFNVGTGISHTVNQIIECIEQISKLSFAKIEYVPQRKCDVRKSVLDISETVNAINYQNESDLESGITEIIDYYMSQRG